jgi:hypothetical protein
MAETKKTGDKKDELYNPLEQEKAKNKNTNEPKIICSSIKTGSTAKPSILHNQRSNKSPARIRSGWSHII